MVKMTLEVAKIDEMGRKKIVRHHRLTIFHLLSYIIIFSLERISPYGRSPSDHDTFLLRVSHFVILFHVNFPAFRCQINSILHFWCIFYAILNLDIHDSFSIIHLKR